MCSSGGKAMFKEHQSTSYSDFITKYQKEGSREKSYNSIIPEYILSDPRIHYRRMGRGK